MKKPEPEPDGPVKPIGEIEHAVVSDLISYLHQDKEHIDSVSDHTHMQLISLIHVIYAALETGNVVRIYVTSDFKRGMGHLKLTPPTDIELYVTSVNYPVFIDGRTVMCEMPSLEVEHYNIPYKYIEDVQIKAGDKHYSLFDLSNGKITFDLYREWFVTNDIENQSSNLIHVDFKNHPSRKGN